MTFGKEGASNGQFFSSHLSKIQLNTRPIDFEKMDTSFLIKSRYDATFLERVSKARLVEPGSRFEGEGRVMYGSYEDFKKQANTQVLSTILLCNPMLCHQSLQDMILNPKTKSTSMPGEETRHHG